MNFIHCLRLVMNLSSPPDSLSLSPSPTHTWWDDAACAPSPAQCTPQCPRFCSWQRLWAHSEIRVMTTMYTSGAQMKPAEILPKSLCLFLIDSQLCEVPHRHEEKRWRTEPDPACTQDPQAFRRKLVSNVILQSSQEQSPASEPLWKQSWKFQSSVLILKYVSTEKGQVDQTIYWFC